MACACTCDFLGSSFTVRLGFLLLCYPSAPPHSTLSPTVLFCCAPSTCTCAWAFVQVSAAQLAGIRQQVASSEYVVVLLSNTLPYEPMTLVALVAAYELGKSILGVVRRMGMGMVHVHVHVHVHVPCAYELGKSILGVVRRMGMGMVHGPKELDMGVL